MNFLQNKIREAIENSGLKIAVLSLSALTLIFAIILSLDLSKEAIVIERGCETDLIKTNSTAQTQEEIEGFLKMAVALRFDSILQRDPSSFMVSDLLAARVKEQDELKRGGVDQRLIVRSIKLNGDSFFIDADRVVAVQKARSAIATILVAQISSKPRSFTNPYGLVLTKIEQLNEVKND